MKGKIVSSSGVMFAATHGPKTGHTSNLLPTPKIKHEFFIRQGLSFFVGSVNGRMCIVKVQLGTVHTGRASIFLCFRSEKTYFYITMIWVCTKVDYKGHIFWKKVMYRCILAHKKIHLLDTCRNQYVCNLLHTSFCWKLSISVGGKEDILASNSPLGKGRNEISFPFGNWWENWRTPSFTWR